MPSLSSGQDLAHSAQTGFSQHPQMTYRFTIPGKPNAFPSEVHRAQFHLFFQSRTIGRCPAVVSEVGGDFTP